MQGIPAGVVEGDAGHGVVSRAGSGTSSKESSPAITPPSRCTSPDGHDIPSKRTGRPRRRATILLMTRHSRRTGSLASRLSSLWHKAWPNVHRQRLFAAWFRKDRRAHNDRRALVAKRTHRTDLPMSPWLGNRFRPCAGRSRRDSTAQLGNPESVAAERSPYVLFRRNRNGLVGRLTDASGFFSNPGLDPDVTSGRILFVSSRSRASRRRDR